MPYGGGPKSGWRRRTADGFVLRPLIQSMICADCGSTGASLMSRFHQFVTGKTLAPGQRLVQRGRAGEEWNAEQARERQGEQTCTHGAKPVLRTRAGSGGSRN